MNMKQHILAGMRDEVDQWEDLLASLTPEQLAAPLLPSHWSVKDVMAHLWAWQQRSIARIEAALNNHLPEFPAWGEGIDPEEEDSTDRVNERLYQIYRDQPWPQVYSTWKEDFQHLLSLSEQVSERDLLDASKYPWLKGYALALILLASYDHHQEHYEKLSTWLADH